MFQGHKISQGLKAKVIWR